MAAERVYDELLCFLGDPIFQVPVRTFMDENCVIFDPSIDISDEHKEVHGRYKKLFDALLESFCTDVKITPAQATQGIAKMADIPDLREVFHVLFEQCQAATDFTAFCQTMVKRNIMIQEQVLRMIMESTGCLPDSLSVAAGQRGDTAPRTAADDKQEQELLKQVMQQSKKEADAASSLEKKETEMLKKTMEISKQEAAALQAERKSMDEQMKKMSLEAKSTTSSSPSVLLLPGPASYSPPTRTNPPTSAKKPSSIPEPASYAPRPAPAAAPAAAPATAAAKSSPAAASGPPPPAAAFSPQSSLPPISGTEAANQWLKSAQAEAGQSAAHAQVAASLSSLSPDELKKRQEYLREQRDKLLAMKKEAREKQLGVAASSQPARPQSSRTARSAMSGASQGGNGDNDDDAKKMQMRRAIADRLKQEVIGKQ